MRTAAPVDRVDVWTTPTRDAGPHLPAYRSLLTPDEAARCERFHHQADRARFLTARALVRTSLSRYVPLAPRAWRLRIEEHGRPEIANLPETAPDLRFNLSHTEGLVVCAVTVAREVGVDVEYIHRALTYQVPERFFSAREVADLRALPAHEQPIVFFDYWTLKESYIKARGLGLTLPLGQFTFVRRPGRAPEITFAPELDDDPASWQFAQFWPTPDHRMAVAVRRRGPDLPVEVFTVVPEVAA